MLREEPKPHVDKSPDPLGGALTAIAKIFVLYLRREKQPIACATKFGCLVKPMRHLEQSGRFGPK